MCGVAYGWCNVSKNISCAFHLEGSTIFPVSLSLNNGFMISLEVTFVKGKHGFRFGIWNYN